MRCFLCLPLEKAQQEQLKILGRIAGVRWVAPEQLHVTLHFLGDLSPDLGERLSRAFARESLGNPMELCFSSLGTFPKGPRGRVLWLGLGGDLEGLRCLHARLEELLEGEGLFVEPRAYFPHVTLARALRGGTIPLGVCEKLGKMDVYKRPWKAEKVFFMKSELFPSGPRYSPLGMYMLG